MPNPRRASRVDGRVLGWSAEGGEAGCDGDEGGEEEGVVGGEGGEVNREEVAGGDERVEWGEVSGKAGARKGARGRA